MNNYGDMAMSLGELLSEEGFRGRRLRTRARASFKSEAADVPLYSFQDQHRPCSSSGAKMMERAKSDIPQRDGKGKMPASDRAKGGIRMDKFTRKENTDKKDIIGKLKRGGCRDFARGDIVEPARSNEIVELGVESNESYSLIYSNQVYSHEGSEGSRHYSGNEESEKYRERFGVDVQLKKRYGNNSNKYQVGRTSFSDNHRKSLKQPEITSSRDSQKFKNVGERTWKLEELEQSVSKLALDEIAVQAMISILSSYIKRFLKDEDFRAFLRHNSFASLNYSGSEEGLNTETKVIANLEQAIETVERAAEESASSRELKKASLQLSVITGLNTNDLKDGFTSGIPNYRLSACAHLYLSVVYKLQKKDRIAAKHLLQVFCDSPSQARTTLLSELWEDMFLPHLLHVKLWYDKEADTLANAPGMTIRLKHLQKTYNEILDSGTYQFAIYYKDWLTEGVEAPSLPSIQLPYLSVREVHQGGHDGRSSDIGSPADLFSTQPKVSKKLYDAMFGRSCNPGVEEEDSIEVKNFGGSAKSSDDYAVEDKQTLTISSSTVWYTCRDIEPDGASHTGDELNADEAWLPGGASTPGEINLNDKFGNFHPWQETLESTDLELQETEAKTVTESVFELNQIQESHDSTDSVLLPHFGVTPNHESLPPTVMSSKELPVKNEDIDGGAHFISSIPQDFVCPLAGCLFDDPVTLETGQTFERVAITEWFDKGNRTCPVTRKNLKFQSVPLTNFILKRVIDSWKFERYSHFISFISEEAGKQIKSNEETAVFTLYQLFNALNKEERIRNAQQILSLGGLQFLIRRFHHGNSDEKSCVASLLSSCIEADAACRSLVLRNIDKPSLLGVLHNEEEKSIKDAVLLLTELICVNRRKDVNFFLGGLKNERILNAKDVLLVYVRSCPLEQTAMVAVLLLHLDLLVEPQQYSIYREEAVDAITDALERSLNDEKVQKKCCRALLILGGRLSSSGKIMTEDWILKQAGFLDGPEPDSFDSEEQYVVIDDCEEEVARQEWLMKLSGSLVGDGRRSFLEALSKCLGSGSMELVRVCLTTAAWLSLALASLSDAEFQLSAFSALIYRLKGCLENGEPIEHKILASMVLLNFSKIPECRVLLMTIGEEISVPLRSLEEVTWIAKELYAIISGEE